MTLKKTLSLVVLAVLIPVYGWSQIYDYPMIDPSLSSAPGAIYAVAGDLNQNGRDDLVVLSNGGIQSHIQTVLPGIFNAMDFHAGDYVCVDIAEANFDGSLDVLTVRNRAGLPPLVEIHEYDGGGLSPWFSEEVGSAGQTASNCKFVPLRGTAYLDIIVTGAGLNGVGFAGLLFNNPAEGWNEHATISDAFSFTDPFGIAAGDFDGTGERSLVISDRTTQNGRSYTFNPSTFAFAFDQSLSATGGHLQAFNLNGRDRILGFGPYDTGELSHIHRDSGNWVVDGLGYGSHLNGWVGHLDSDHSSVQIVHGVNESFGVLTFDGTAIDAYGETYGAMTIGNVPGIVVLDVTGDGQKDFAGVGSGGGFEWYTNQTPCGTFNACLRGTFCSAGTTCMPHPAPYETLRLSHKAQDAVFAGLFNGSQMDLATISDAGLSVHQRGVQFSSTPQWNGAPANSSHGRAIAVGDCNGDGHLDLIGGMSVGGIPSFVTYTNQGGLGTFTHSQTVGLTGMGLVSDLALGDVDGDGHLDLAIVQENGPVQIFQGLGNCTFTTSPRFEGTTTLAGARLLFTDVSGDISPELIATGESGGGYVLIPHYNFNYATWSYQVPMTYLTMTKPFLDTVSFFNGGERLLSAFGTIQSTFHQTPPIFNNITNWGPAANALALGDFGQPFLGAVYGLLGAYELYPTLNTLFGSVRSLRSGLDPAMIRVGRFTNQALPEIATFSYTGTTTTVEFDRPAAAPLFSPALSSPPGFTYRVSDFALADVSGNGNLDIVVAAYNTSPLEPKYGYFTNQGSVGFGSFVDFNGPYPVESTGIAVGNLNGDGRLDLFINGNSASTPFIRDTAGNTPLGGFPGGGVVKLYDIDMDGNLDIIRASNTGGPDDTILISTDRGLSWVTLPVDVVATSIDVGDINGDGYPDIVVGATDGIYQFLNDQMGGWIHGDISAQAGPWHVFLTDYTGNGDLDLVSVRFLPMLAYRWPNNGIGSFSGPTAINTGWTLNVNNSDATIGDVTNNGKDELIVARSVGNFVTVRVLNIVGPPLIQEVSATYPPMQSPILTAVRLADLDNDGDLDLITAQNFADDKFLVWKNNLVSSPSVSSANMRTSNTTTTAILGRPNQPRNFTDGGGGRPILGDSANIPITLYDRENDPAHVRIEFNLNRSGVWHQATIDPSTPLGPLATSKDGITHTLRWNIADDRAAIGGVLSGSDVRLRARVQQTPLRSTYPIWTSEMVVVSPPMQVLDGGCVSCPPGHVCLYGDCFAPCDPGICPGGQTCHDGVCFDGDPCDNITCPGGHDCLQGACFPNCSDNDDCTPPSLCFDALCQDPSDLCDGILCGPGLTCFLGTCFPENVCMPGSCGADECYGDVCAPEDPCDVLTCPTDYTCHQGTCFQTCTDSDECTPPLACYDFGCALPNNPCANVVCPLGQTCFQGECFQQCSTNADCTLPAFDVCYDSTFCASSDLCLDITCPEGFACYQGGCFQLCDDNDDCSPPFVCFEELCRDGNEPCDAIACPEGNVCYLGTCFDSCDNNGDCNPPYSACMDTTVCLETSDLCFGIVCPGGMACHQGQCIESCSGTDPCVSPFICYTEFCGTAGNPCDGILCPLGMGCYEGGCFSSCATSDECAIPDLCYYDVGGGMSNPERCVTGPCDAVFCPLGQSCFGGACYPLCDAMGNCDDPNDVCYDNNLCMPPDLCDEHYCPIGQACSGGSCFVSCSANSDCPGYVGFGASFSDVAESVNLNTPWSKNAGVAWGDFNNDGCLDLVLNTSSSTGRSRLYMSNCAANPIFTDVTSTRAPHFLAHSRERSIIVADWNNDGLLDVARNTTNVINIYKNSGSPDHNLELSKTISESISEGMGWIDYNGNRWLDLAYQEGTSGIKLYRNNTMGDFVLQTGVGLASGSDGDFCAVADLNLDGHVDILCRIQGTTTADLYMNNGDGTFTGSSAFNQNASSNRGGVTVCDVDNDGLFDIIWTDNGTNQIWRQGPIGVFTPTGEPAASSGFALPTSAGFNDVLCGDVDHDGRQDLFWIGEGGSYLLMNRSTPGSLSFVRRNLGINSTSSAYSGAMADFNRDGSLDILVHADDRNELWQNPRNDKRYLMIRALVNLVFAGEPVGTVRDGIGATVVIRDADGGMLGLREVSGGRGRGSQDPAMMHFGLPYGPNVPYHLTVTWPHGAQVQRCVVPSTIPGYQLVEILDTAPDDISACTNAGDWSALIELPSNDNQGDFCFGNRCASDACEDIICPKGSTCYGGNCRPECVSGMCPGALTCIDGACVPDACDGGDFVCPVNFGCANGECAPLCTGDSDCDAGQFCYQGVCVVNDCTGVTCPGGQSCHEGICFTDCALDSDCPGTQNCYDGRCASDGCAAMDFDYDDSYYSRATNGHLSITRPSLPWFWPRPFIGAPGVSFKNWAGNRGSTIINTDVPQEKMARVALYLDRTASTTTHPEGRYVLWFNQGAAVGGQGAAEAAYRVQFTQVNPQEAFDSDGESVQIMSTGLTNHRVAHAYVTSGAGQTGGVAFSRIGSDPSVNWIIQIDAEFSGDIRRWEWVNADGSVIELDPSETLQIAITDVGDKFYARESGKACTTPAQGICRQGTAYCQLWELRCQQTVLPWMFEVCDGKDNNCNGSIDEPENMRFAHTEWRDDLSSWQFFLTLDKSQPVQEAMGFVPRGADDRIGSSNIISTDGSGSIQEWNRAVLAMHRNMITGSIALLVANGLDFTGAIANVGDYDVETRLRFPGEHTIDEVFPAFWDDRKSGSTDDEIPTSYHLDRMNLEWEMKQTGSGASARREADSAAFMTRWSGAKPSLAEVEMSYQWRTHADTDTSSPRKLNFGIHRPSLPFRQVPRTRSIFFRVSPAEREETACYANGAVSPGGCNLGYYTCGAGGTITCSTPTDDVCDRCVDADGDGFDAYDEVMCPTGRDCNDNDPNINPKAPERCNGLDNDCDGLVDIKSDAAYLAIWGESREASWASCPVGEDTCGPEECQFRNVCICPDGPMDPLNPPARSCYCGEGVEPDGR